MRLNRALFGIFLLGIIAVHGQSYIRFANANSEFGSSYLGVATEYYGVINGLKIEEAPIADPLPFSPYLSLPQFDLPLNQQISFYLYDVYSGYALLSTTLNATLIENQSYTFIAAGSTYSATPLTLFSVEERPSNISLFAGKSALKFVNAVESAYGSPFFLNVYKNAVAVAYVPSLFFGSSSNFLAFDADQVDVDVFTDFSTIQIRNLTLQRDATTFVYFHGHNSTDSSWTVKVVPFSGPGTESPVATPVSSAPIGNTPVSSPSTAVIRLINAAYVQNTHVVAVMHTENYQFVSATSVATSSVPPFYGDNIFGGYLTVPSNIPITFVVDGFGLQRTLVLPTNSRSSLVFCNSGNGTQSNYTLLYLDESPASYPTHPQMRMYRVVNTRLFDTLRVYTTDWQERYVNFGSYVDISAANISYIFTSDNYGISYFEEQARPNTLMTYYIIGSASDHSFFYFSDQTELLAPTPQNPICANGYLETTGYCNCYSGYTDDYSTPNWHCTVSPPYWCPITNQTGSTDSGATPNLANLQVTQGNLALSVYSSFSAGRRTYIEFSNSACNLINHPSYYTKTTNWNYCYDQFNVQIPFAACGFTKTSFNDQDVYRGDMHVKFIDTITVNDRIIERVIDTPFTLVVRLPKNIAIQSSVEVIAAPVYTVPLTAALVSQRVITATQTAQLVYVTSVPAQFIVERAIVQQYPYGVNTSLYFTSTNCTANFCLQYLTVDLGIAFCEISGFYRFDVLISCRDQQNCPPDARDGVGATITSTIQAQRSCGDVSVDVGLQGSLRAYNSPSFTNQALAFNAGQPAYFLVNTFSPQVVISRVTLDQVYYQGPNVQGHFLLTDGVNVSSRAANNNFTWGQLTSSQLWFSFDVTVSKLISSADTLFKIDNGQSGVYYFMAVVEVEWLLAGTPNANVPITLPIPSDNSTSPYPFKKRMVLQGTASQGSQFTAELQIAGPDASTQPSATQPDNGSVSTGTVLTAVFSLCACLIMLSI
eukprot:TRINITY_DN3128_c0_g1_i1.p1 TRINITY_DN3128_c0_g1~~TRINITY_DN3128_c0_g1_i1.p1  ORF type:complete len:1004 (+),score=133.59 TRINITY_DN3128_c0_g1_i1:37-3012(+)